MKKLYRLVAFLLLASRACLAQGPPTNIPNAVIATFPGAPSGTCSPTMIATRTDTGAFYDCFGGVWTAVSSGAGIVTSVTGTANQLSVATGTTAPVISLPSATTFPGTLGLASGTHGAPVVFNTSGQLATSPVSIDASVQAGADWSIKVNAAFTALGSPFGTVDARGFTTSQVMSVNVTIPSGDTLLLPCVVITRNGGIQFILNNSTRMIGCGSVSRNVTYLASGGSDGSAVITGATEPLTGVDLEAFQIGVAGTGAIGISLAGVEGSHFRDLGIKTDIGIAIGGDAWCACYNDFENNSIQATTYGMKFLQTSNQNQVYGGTSWGGTIGVYVAPQAGLNQFYAVDVEGGGSTASFDFAGSANSLISPYLEATGPIIFESGVVSNYVTGVGNTVITDNSGNYSNFVQTTGGGGGSLGHAPYALTAQNAFFFGTDMGNGTAGDNNEGLEISAPGGYGGSVDMTYIGSQNLVGYTGHAALKVGGFKSYSGHTDTGKVTVSALATPSAPTVVATGGTGTNYTYYVVCHDYSGGVTLPSSGTTVSGGATLSVSVYNTLTPPTEEGCWQWDILSGTTDASIFTAKTCSTTYPCKDTGQSTSVYSPPARNTTGDQSVAGNQTISGNETVSGSLSAGAATATSLLAAGIVDGEVPVTVTTGATANLGGTYYSGYTFNEEATAGTAVAYTLPTAAAGRQYCVANAFNGSAPNTGALTIQTSASGQYIIFTDGTVTASGGYVVSNGAAADAACIVGVDSSHWLLSVQSGKWAKH